MKRFMVAVLFLALMVTSASANGIFKRFENPGDDGFPAHEIGAIFQFWADGVFSNPTARNKAELLCNCVVSNFDAQQFTHIKGLIDADTHTAGQIRDAIILYQVGLVTRDELYTYFSMPNNLKDPEDQ